MADLYGVLTTLRDDQRAVRFVRDYAVGVDDLWSALNEPDRLARWLDPVSGELSVGGRVTVHFDDGDAAFEVVACEAPHRLVVRWVHDADRSSEVAVAVSAVAGGSRLVLEHALLSATSAPGYAAGWHWHLDALDAVLRGEEPGAWSSFDALYADYRQGTL
jgi:uncharacterized protein YndB with AHSA1/START domain